MGREAHTPSVTLASKISFLHCEWCFGIIQVPTVHKDPLHFSISILSYFLPPLYLFDSYSYFQIKFK